MLNLKLTRQYLCDESVNGLRASSQLIMTSPSNNEKFVDMEHNEKFVHLGIPISFVGHQTILCQADYLSGLKSSEGRPAL